MPSFDVVSKVNLHEVTNGVDQANREVSTRFDFKGSEAKFDFTGSEINMVGDSDFQLKQMLEILKTKLAKRHVDLRCLDPGIVSESGKGARQSIAVRQGLDTDLARKIVKLIKEKKLKVQAAVQGDEVRVSGKKRDDLQAVIASLKEEELNIPLQFVNFRD
jgi:uncharacterized protein YajQ (UPF0234 family)